MLRDSATPLARHHALVLAAGKGSRMGSPKALMEVAGRPWWQIQKQRLAAAKINATWIVSEPVRDAVAHSPSAPDLLVLGDSNAPMFSSVLAGLSSLATTDLDGVFILPVDVPAPHPSVWAALATYDSPTIPSHNGKRGHPVHLPQKWIRDLLHSLGSAANATQPSESLRLDSLIGPTARIIEVSDPTVCVNLNTMADVQAFLTSTDPFTPEPT